MAAIKGRTQVVAQMVRDVPDLIRVLTDRGESVMHLCVLKNRREALKTVVEEVMGIGGEESDQLVNWRDCDGNTALHIAVAKRQVEVNQFPNILSLGYGYSELVSGFIHGFTNDEKSKGLCMENPNPKNAIIP